MFITYCMASGNQILQGVCVSMKAANRIYVNEQFVLKEEFQSNLQKYFGAEAETVPFQQDAARFTSIKWWMN